MVFIEIFSGNILKRSCLRVSTERKQSAMLEKILFHFMQLFLSFASFAFIMNSLQKPTVKNPCSSNVHANFDTLTTLESSTTAMVVEFYRWIFLIELINFILKIFGTKKRIPMWKFRVKSTLKYVHQFLVYFWYFHPIFSFT